jgi:hypothetical protein
MTGYFNLNLIKESSQKSSLIEFANKHNLKFVISIGQVSTDYMTQLALCMSNIESKKISAGYLKSIFSYHKPILIRIKLNRNNKFFSILIIFNNKILLNS